MMAKSSTPSAPETTKRFTFAVSEDTLESLKTISELEKRSVGWVIREALDGYVKRYPFPPDQLSLLPTEEKP